ncbi:hypothetical protein N7491_001781 [Penicillium cf. griseofulvum]|uniref:Uncharacterized protein n=1 Tax=Penicillium cf. griseofulvum TaxID=2972120 RepID=A0A9W9JCB8_9EURO|nr:hypothetical protein N7472_006909 [Penicillium cf. griseofulvum]KAJ5445699.1 hypothetical protein N7491_001781 [Penicillium cf. griseofulvum]KAJ5447421.1 hypothetical protein N7445_002242 [Penicillium cf. griseofulvum]
MATKFVTSTNSMVLRYWSKCNTPPVAARYLNSPTHPIRPKIVDLCAHRERKTLWWRVSVSQIQQSKRVVRSWCGRRVRIAFEQALKQQGLDKLGKPLVSECPSRGKKLTGTIEIYIQPPCVTQDFEGIQKDAHHLLTLLLDHESTRK